MCLPLSRPADTSWLRRVPTKTAGDDGRHRDEQGTDLKGGRVSVHGGRPRDRGGRDSREKERCGRRRSHRVQEGSAKRTTNLLGGIDERTGDARAVFIDAEEGR